MDLDAKSSRVGYLLLHKQSILHAFLVHKNEIDATLGLIASAGNSKLNRRSGYTLLSGVIKVLFWLSVGDLKSLFG